MMKKTLLTAAVLATLATSAMAADSSFYVGADVGMSQPTPWQAPSNNSPSLDLAYGGHVGVLTAPNAKGVSYGLELGSTVYAPNTKSGVKVSANSWNYLGVAKFSLEKFLPGFAVLGKAGVAYMQQNASYSVFGAKFVQLYSAYRPMMALGVSYDLPKIPALSLGLSWQYIAGPDMSTTASYSDGGSATAGNEQIQSMHAVLASVNYSF